MIDKTKVNSCARNPTPQQIICGSWHNSIEKRLSQRAKKGNKSAQQTLSPQKKWAWEHDTNGQVFNLDKCGFASDLTSIELVLKTVGPGAESRH